MNESVLLAKVRKETKITVPAGGYVVLVSPDKPFHEHLAKRSELLKAGTVNEEYESLVIGRVRNTHPVANFSTAAEVKAAKEESARVDEALTKSAEDAKKRQEQMAKDEAAKAQKEHEKRVAEVTKENDAIRTREVTK